MNSTFSKSSNRNVCHLTSVHYWQDTRIFLKECTSLAASGYTTYLVAPNAPNEAKNLVNFQGVKKFKTSRILRFTKTVWDTYDLAVSIDADLYHFHDPELIPVGLLLKLQGKKVIYDVHEDVPGDILTKDWIPTPFRKLTALAFEKLENFAAPKFDAIVTATPFIRQRFLKLNPLTIDINNYPILTELVTPESSSPEKEKSVCYVGGICQIRGILEMVQAIGMTDTTLLLGGTFSNAGEKVKAESLTGWQNVRALGQLNRQEVADVLSRSVAGLVLFCPAPNHVDAQPNKMFEYMSAGIPVIASNFPLWREIIEGNNCGICVDPLNPQEISEAIQYLINHPEAAAEMGKNGSQAVETKYNWEQEAQKLLSLYQELLPTQP
ncbi:glycosyltransferase family 4 protein [Sphaerospermopsis sp. LEGE 08334]|uniref:glycosyltransferase family 4 protein n=1 Tax=Sphaerospermopsis sp. LEGE 08334 TaxID=1828651 RepID=UPI0018814DEC|nr:glycosyltransferase family 4 protein [Sphaerospermopsis sp. LEGE 08334]MBE9059133.1 glycosyltransferase family 4 protein [Sphaerospermopsis sp. LEGE 08334]